MMKNRSTQSGKGLSGFLIGLVLATAVIAGVLFFLNKNKTPYKQPEIVSEPSAPEILTPENASEPVPASVTGESASDASGVAAASEPAAPAAIPEEHTGKHSTPPAVKTQKPSDAHSNPPAHKTEPKTQTPRVSPEAILNNGSLEKAQEAARSQREAAQGRVILQIGSFNTRADADSQRAKLAMLSIDTQIRTATVNGKTVYRVQTDAVSRSQADTVGRKLHQQNIPFLMRSAS